MTLPNQIDPLFLGPATGGYTIGRSLRFRSSASAYLNRTAGTPTNANIWTWSGWVKRGTLSTRNTILCGGSTNVNYICFNDSGTTDYFGLTYSNTPSQLVNVMTTQVFRDPSAWYHLMVVYDSTSATSTITGSATDRVRLYVNGSQVNAFSATSGPTQNTSVNINTASSVLNIGRRNIASPDSYLDAYLAEQYFVDGQALTPSSFGAYDTNGVWQPLKYGGTYGTNGFYLPFSNTTSTTTLVQDSSGNGNNWTPNNISLTAGTTYDSMIDSPTVSASSSNYAVLNPLTIRGATGTLTNGNLLVAASSSSSPADTSMYATLALPSNGLIYLEALYTVTAGLGNDTRIGVSTVGDTGSYVQAGSTTGYWSYDYKNGTANAQGSNTSYTAASTGQTVMFAIDVANGKIWAGANGTWYNSGNPASGTGAVLTSVSTSAVYLQTTVNGWVNRSSLDFNFGQRPFTYTPPSGYSALNTYNLPSPVITNGALYNASTLYTGTGASNTISNSASAGGNNPLGKTFYPDLTWIKSRSAATDHKLTDSVRGVTKALISDTTGAETTDANGLTAFSSTGFTVGTDTTYNNNTATYVAWQWNAGSGSSSSNTSGSITSTVSVNTTSGFSIVTYSGNATTGTIGHGLGAVPQMIIVFNRTLAGRFHPVYHVATGNASSAFLASTAAANSQPNLWNSTTPTSTVFSIGADNETNGSGYNFVAYCFAAVKGYSAFGSYTGNGSADGPFVFTNFRPRYVLLKNVSTSATNWIIFDTSRNTYNVSNLTLDPASSNAELTSNGWDIDILSNGFKIRNTSTSGNGSGNTIIYAAFCENPFNYSRAR